VRGVNRRDFVDEIG